MLLRKTLLDMFAAVRTAAPTREETRVSFEVGGVHVLDAIAIDRDCEIWIVPSEANRLTVHAEIDPDKHPRWIQIELNPGSRIARLHLSGTVKNYGGCTLTEERGEFAFVWTLRSGKRPTKGVFTTVGVVTRQGPDVVFTDSDGREWGRPLAEIDRDVPRPLTREVNAN